MMQSVCRRGLLFVLVAATLLTAAGSASAAGWLATDSVPLTVSDLGFDALGNTVAVGLGADPDDPAGSPMVRATARPLGGRWSESVPVSRSSDGDDDPYAPEVAVGPDGSAVAVWSAHSDALSSRVIRVASRSAGGAWSEPVRLSSGPAANFRADHDVAIDEHGTATVVWTELDETANAVRSASASVGGDWNAAAAAAAYLSDGSAGNAVSPRLALDPQGSATAVWIQLESWAVLAKSRLAGGEWSAIAVPLSVGGIPEDPQLAVDPQGNATALWTLTSGDGTTVHEAHRVAADGAWPPTSQKIGDGSSPQLVVGPGGSATAIWLSPASPGPVVGTSSRATAAGDWSAPVDLAVSSDAGAVRAAWVGADPQGNATAVWGRDSGSEVIAQASRRLTEGNGWSAPIDLSIGPLGPAINAIPAAGVDPQGNTTMAWSGSASPLTSSSSVFDPVAPELRDVAVPATGVVGQPLDMAVHPFDAWSAVTTSWDFGDGQSGSGAAVSHTYGSPGQRTVTITGVDSAGNTTQTSQTITVDPVPVPGPEDPGPDPGPGPGPGPGPEVPRPGPDRAAPVLSGLRQSSSRWRTHRVRRGARLPVGTTFRFTLDRPARVRFAVSQIVPGRRVNARCARATKANRKKPRCDRYQARGTLSITGKAGNNAYPFRGKIHGRTLKPGRYRVQVSAAADGIASAAATVRFTIAR